MSIRVAVEQQHVFPALLNLSRTRCRALTAVKSQKRALDMFTVT